MTKVLCVGGPKNGEYVEVDDPYRGLFVPVLPRHPGWGSDVIFEKVYYRLEELAIRQGFVAPVFVAEDIRDDEMVRALVPLIFKPEFLETRT